mgnify:CR=1 FL=1
MLRGNAPAKIDDRGRLKVPTAFRAVIQQEYGRELFVTSLTGESVRVYPMPIWLEIETRISKMPSTLPARMAVGRVRVKPGTHTVDLVARGVRKRQRLVLRAGDWAVVTHTVLF